MKTEKDPLTAEDLTQETFIKAYRNLDKLENNSNLLGWLYRIATNTFIDFCRRNNKNNLLESISELDPATLPSVENTLDHNLLRDEFKGMFHEICKTLPPKYCRAIFLYEYEHYSYTQAAKIMDISLSAYTSLFNRARIKLKEATIAYLLKVNDDFLTKDEYSTLAKWIDPTQLSGDISEPIKLGMKDYFNERAQFYNGTNFHDYHQLIDDYILQKYPLTSEHVTADIGMGTGIFTSKLSRYVKRVEGYDSSKEMCSLAQHKFKLQKITNVICINKDFFEQETTPTQYDYAYCITVLHHLAFPQKAIKKMVSMLKKDGGLIVSDFAKHKYFEIAEKNSDLWYGFSKEQFFKFLTDAGLRDVWVEVRSDFPRIFHLDSGKIAKIPTIIGGGRK
jgi:RNA polymerase sigma factor (sigma-70 family)